MFDTTRRAALTGATLAAGLVHSGSSAEATDLAHFGVTAAAKDNSDGFQAAFDAAAHGALVLALAPGVYRISRPLRIRYPLALVGSGVYDMNTRLPGCAIVSTGFAAPVLTVEPAGSDRLRGFALSGFLLDCNGQGGGISFRRCADFALTRIGVRDAQGPGLEFLNSWDAAIMDAFVSHCGRAETMTGAVEIAGETFADNSNSLHFFGARVESSHGPSLVILPPLLHSGPNNNIQFVASKFHLPAGDGSTPPAPNLILNPAEVISFHGAQIFDSGGGFPVIDFGSGPAMDSSYAFFGCDIDVRTGDALIGGDLSAAHRFFGCTLRSDPAVSQSRKLYLGSGNLVQRIRESNNVYRLS